MNVPGGTPVYMLKRLVRMTACNTCLKHDMMHAFSEENLSYLLQTGGYVLFRFYRSYCPKSFSRMGHATPFRNFWLIDTAFWFIVIRSGGCLSKNVHLAQRRMRRSV